MKINSNKTDLDLSDFTIGFLEGIAIALLVAGVGYLIWCKVKKEKPFE